MLAAAVLLSISTLALGLSSGDLKVSVTTSNNVVDSVDDIIISTVVSNPTDQDIRILAKNNVLDSSETFSFSVSKDGSSVLFTGIRATYDLDEPSLYTTIPAGSSVAVNHTDLRPLFDFETHGTGKFVFTPNTIFQSGPSDVAVDIQVEPIDITINSDVKKRELISMHKRAPATSTPTCGDSGRLQVLKDSLSYARSMAGGAASDIRTHPNGAEWNTYFAGNDHDEIWWRMDLIAGDLDQAGKRGIHCNSDPGGLCTSTSGVIAYTVIVTSGGNIIYTCDNFFTSVGDTPGTCTSDYRLTSPQTPELNLVTGGFDTPQSSRGGVILHEMSHATVATSDISYGCSNTAKLSQTDKRNNADNYRCMGLAIYHTYNCPH